MTQVRRWRATEEVETLDRAPSQPGRRVSITAGSILLLLVASALFAPPVSVRSSIRPDSIAVYILLPMWIVLTGGITLPRQYRTLAIGLAALPLGVALATAAQHIVAGALPGRYWLPAAGLLRTSMFGLLAIIALHRDWLNLRRTTQLLLLGAAAHGAFAVVELFQVPPAADLLHAVYGNGDVRPGVRAIGAFGTVHSLAYFAVYGVILGLSVSLMRIAPVWSAWAIAGGMVALLLTFSRSGMISAVAAAAVFLLVSRYSKTFVKFTGLGVVGVVALLLVLPAHSVQRLVSTASDAWLLVKAVSGGDVAATDAGFISGRLGHGWQHSLESWTRNPFIGNIRAHESAFLGDGGYTTMLGEFGLIGILGFMAGTALMFYGAWRVCAAGRVGRIARAGLLATAVAFYTANIAASALRERTLELMPVIVVVLAVHGSRRELGAP